MPSSSLTLLLVPSLLAIATVPAGVDLAAAEVQLSQIQLKLQGQAAEQEFDAVAASTPPAPNSALSDEQALNQLTHLYDHGVTLHYVKVGGLSDHSASHVRLDATREHILHSALSQRPGDHPPLPTGGDLAQSSVERYYIDMATGQTLSPEAVRFREEMRTEIVEKRPDVWRVMKAKAEGLAHSFQMPEDLGTLRAMLVSRVATATFDVGHDLPPDLASLGSGIEDSVAEDAYRVRSRKAWAAFLSAHDGSDVVAAMNGDANPAVEIDRDKAVARRVPEMDALEQRVCRRASSVPDASRGGRQGGDSDRARHDGRDAARRGVVRRLARDVRRLLPGSIGARPGRRAACCSQRAVLRSRCRARSWQGWRATSPCCAASRASEAF